MAESHRRTVTGLDVAVVDLVAVALDGTVAAEDVAGIVAVDCHRTVTDGGGLVAEGDVTEVEVQVVGIVDDVVGLAMLWLAISSCRRPGGRPEVVVGLLLHDPLRVERRREGLLRDAVVVGDRPLKPTTGSPPPIATLGAAVAATVWICAGVAFWRPAR